MKSTLIAACVATSLLFTTTLAIGEAERPGSAGGYSAVSVTNPAVLAAAAFAITAEQPLRPPPGLPTAKLELVKILSAQAQVVAGLNYRLKLKVRVNGIERLAEVVVWWQAWRTPDPYRLTAWNWSW